MVLRIDELSSADTDSLLLHLQEPSLASLGLAGHTPSGFFQAVLEHVHLGCDLPWWGTIVATTCAFRILLIPLYIRSRRNAAVLHNVTPELEKIQSKISAAKTKHEVLEHRKEYFDCMSKYGVSPTSTLIPVLGNASIFTTMFFALRGMTGPVESLKTGGTAWFYDLSAADPFFLLPLLTTSSLLVNLWIGGDGLDLNSLPPFMRKLIFVLPIISFPVMCSFPSALNVYWLFSNLFTITQARIISIPKIRESFGIPALIKKPKEETNVMKRIEELVKEVNDQSKKR